MRAQVFAFAAALAVPALGTDAAAAGTIDLRPGLWQVTSEVWIDGKAVLAEIDAAGQRASAEVMRRARAQMSAAERAEFDRAMAASNAGDGRAQSETECIPPAEARIDARDALEQAMQALYQPPWTCSFSGANASAAAQTLSFSYRCQTSAGARAEGQARFEASQTRYRHELAGRSHAMDMETGKPLDARLLPVRSVTTGRWVSAQCER